MFYEVQLDWIRAVQAFLGPGNETFWNFFDSTSFYVLLSILVYFLTSARSGLKFISLSLFNHVFVTVAKVLFHMPRPCVFDPSISKIPCNSFAFPSGGAQAAMLFTLLFVYYVKNPWLRGLAFVYFLVANFARIYVGAHFFTDILGGWLFGGLIFLFYLYAFPPLEKWLSRIPFFLVVVVMHLFLLLFIFAALKKLVITYFVLAASFLLGIWIAHTWNLLIRPDEKWYKKIVLAAIGLTGLILIPHYDAVSFYPVGLWLSLGSILILRLIFPKTPRWREERLP